MVRFGTATTSLEQALWPQNSWFSAKEYLLPSRFFAQLEQQKQGASACQWMLP
jgi:hypothetical protein